MRFDRASPAARPQSIGGRGWRQWQGRHAHTAADLSKLAQHKNLDAQSISYSATNGSLVLKGSVKTQAQKNEANKLARAVPNVKEVVNEIEVKPDKHSTTH